MLLAAMLGVSAPLAAQGGAWYTLGGGAASNRVSCDNCEEITRHWGGSGYLRAGGHLNTRVRLGGELYFWQGAIGGSEVYVRVAQGIVLWHPWQSGGFFAQAGLGLSRLRNVFDLEGATVRASETGISVMLGLGYEVRIAGRFHLTPSLSSVVVPTATIDTPSGALDNVVATVFQLGLGVTFR